MSEWKSAQKKKKVGHAFSSGERPYIYPKRHYWCGFDSTGKEKWYIELNSGRVVSYLDDNYLFWLRKFWRFRVEEEGVK